MMKAPWFARLAAVGLRVALLGAALGGCDRESYDEQAQQRPPDARLKTHAVVEGQATVQGLAYLGDIAEFHRAADRADDPQQRVLILREALAVPVPANIPEAEILRLELATRLSMTLSELPEGGPAALALLEPMLEPERSLPVHRASARALVALGDLAVLSGDDALAAGSYARAIRVMSLLRQELER